MKYISFVVAFLTATTIFAQKNTETRAIGSFDRIDISGGFQLIELKEGSEESVRIEASGVALDKIETDIVGNTLRIRMKRGSYNDTRIKMLVTYKQLDEVSNSGSSDIEALNTIKGPRFSLNSSGSGDFRGDFDVEKLTLSISGSSDMTLRGQARRQSIAISGSGDIDAAKLTGSEASVAISGSGDVVLGVNGPVRTAISGSGTVVTNKQ
jgi:Putative auto-transporter adhesin, head GIN domain